MGTFACSASRRALEDPELEAALAGHIRGDLCREETARQAVEAVLADQGRLDVLINNAGMGIGGALEDTDDAQLHRLMELNFFAMARMCRCALPAMRRQGRGKVINISSLGGLAGLPFQGAYSASKYAVEGYSEALRSEVRPFGCEMIALFILEYYIRVCRQTSSSKTLEEMEKGLDALIDKFRNKSGYARALRIC